MRTMLFTMLMVVVLVSLFTVPATAQGQRDFWAYSHVCAEDGGFNVPLLRVRGLAPVQGMAVGAEYDLSAERLIAAFATDTLATLVASVGALNTPLCDVFPAPYAAFFSKAPEACLAPPFNDVGMVASRRLGSLTLTTGMLSGEGSIDAQRTPTTDGVFLAKLQASGLKFSLLGQSGERVDGRIRRYGTVQSEWKHDWLVLGAGYARRYDLAKDGEGAHAEARVDLGFVEVGVRGEKPDRLTAALVRSLGWKTALQVEANAEKDHHVMWSAAFQYAVDLLKLKGGQN